MITNFKTNFNKTMIQLDYMWCLSCPPSVLTQSVWQWCH